MPPPCVTIPFSDLAPEKQLKRDSFHVMKLGIFRDHIASSIAWMIHNDLFGINGDFESKLKAGFGSF